MAAYLLAYLDKSKDEAHIAAFGSMMTLCGHLALFTGDTLPVPTVQGLPEQPQPWCGACKDAYSA